MAIKSSDPPKPEGFCFSYASYTKDLIHYLKSFNVPFEEGLTDIELSSIESNLKFTFPPDLRSVLREGLPVGPGFPNWRSTSTQKIQNLTISPISDLCKRIKTDHFWLYSWGERPKDIDQAVNLGKEFLKNVPALIPVYWNFYIPAVPCLAGNPVFYVHQGDVRLWSFDIAGFFHQVELRVGEDILKRPSLYKLMNVPAWAATEARRIEFWTDLVERGERLVVASAGWWWSDDYFCGRLDDVFWRLRKAGWKEEDVREMMMMDGYDNLNPDGSDQRNGTDSVVLDREFVHRHVDMLSERLLQAGWSTADVAESLGSIDENNHSTGSLDDDNHDDPEESWFDCQQPIYFCNWMDDNAPDTNVVMAIATEMMNKHPIKV